MNRLTLASALISVVGFCAIAAADLVPVGDPLGGTSWSQRFNESGIGSFDLVAVKMVTAGDWFASPTHSSFNKVNWSLLYEDAPPNTIKLASASGPSVTSLDWNVRFFGNTANPFTFHYVAFNGNQIANAARATWGPGWNIVNYPGGVGAPWTPNRGQVIPAPGAALLGAIGLGLVGWVKRRLS